MERGATVALTLILAVIALVQCRTLIPLTEGRLAESNRYVDNLAAHLRTDYVMKNYDPMLLRQERFDDEKGHVGVLNKTTVTGLTSIDRHGNVTISDFYDDLTFVIRAVLKTNVLRVCSHLTATANGKTIEGQVYGNIPNLSIEISILVWPNGTARLAQCHVPFVHMNETEFGGDERILEENTELMLLVNEALEYTMKIKHSANIYTMVTSKKHIFIQGMIENFVSKTKIPISD